MGLVHQIVESMRSYQQFRHKMNVDY